MEEILKSKFMDVIEETRSVLKANNEWQERYARYAQKIRDNLDAIKIVRRSFHERSPLNVYLNITSAKNAKNSVGFELRYMGQTVATLKGNKDKKHKLNTTKRLEETNRRDFGCKLCLSEEDWCGEKAAEFRSFFKNRNGPRKADSNRKNEEHRLQSLLLAEFSKAKNKALRNIKPVTIGGVRFPMPTPISASDHTKIKLAKPRKSGGIDILTRIGKGGKATHLCIMELKDENTKHEPPKDVMIQAVAYATFIRELLRSGSGTTWWRLFGFSGEEIPTPLVLYAACVMPSSDYNDYSFRDMELDIEGDTIKLHYLYFQEVNQVIIKPGRTTLGIIE